MCHSRDNVEKYCRAGWAIDDNLAHAAYLRPHTHSEYVILIAFLLQQWLHKCVSMISYMNIFCLIEIYIPYFSIDNAHLMYNAHPKLFRHSF